MAQPPTKYSLRLTLDIKGREKRSVWPWMVVVLVGLIVLPLMKRLVGITF